MPTLTLGATVQTARVPELPPLTGGLVLDLADVLPIYISSENKTKKVPLSVLNTFFNTGGGGGVHAPVVNGGELIYIVDAAADNTDTAAIPTLVGKDFTLERGGFPLIALLPDLSNGPAGTNTAEFEILNSGGFKLLQSGDVLHLSERFKLTIFSLIGTSLGSTGGGSFIKGKKVVSADTTLDPVLDANKVIQIRGTSSSIVLTIPSVIDIPVNSFYAIESNINNTKPSKVQTTAGQLIYLNSGSKTAIYLMPGEVCWLFRDDDGLYVINDFSDKYKSLAKPQAAYKADLNQLVCKGQTVLRTDWPRLWEYVQTLGASFITDADWSIASVLVSGRTVLRPYRGCFSSGDGSTTFRLPDLLDQFIRGVKSETGSDAERNLNKPGGYQDDMLKAHSHDVNTTGNATGVDPGRAIKRQSTDGDGFTAGAGTLPYVGSTGGVETRPGNVGYLWVING